MRAEIINEIEALELHYFRPAREPSERQRWLADYLDDLGDMTREALSAACRAWRQSGAKKFPTSGELRRMAPLQATSTLRVEPWRPLSDEEYDQLTLREKIRHQRILVHEAEMKAGPQMREKVPLDRADMPEKWHFWRGQAANHAAEAKHLIDILKGLQLPARA